MCTKVAVCAFSAFFDLLHFYQDKQLLESAKKVLKKKKPSALHHSDRRTLSERFGVGEILPACEVS